jgi:transcription initiation factor IIE alpha subunit
MTYKNTSGMAYASIQDNLGQNQQIVYKVIQRLGEANNQQIGRELGWEINKVTPRVYELRDKNMVEEAREGKDIFTLRQTKFWRIKRKEIINLIETKTYGKSMV